MAVLACYLHFLAFIYMTLLNFRFRIPVTVRNNRTEDAGKLQNEWVSLIKRYCKGASPPQEGSQGCASSEADYEDLVVPLGEQKEEALRFGVSSATASLNKSSDPQTKPAEVDTAPASPALPLPTRKAEVPPAPPALLKPRGLSHSTKRTKAFHWDVVPCDKVRIKPMVTIKEKKKMCPVYVYISHKNTALPQSNLGAFLYVWIEQSDSAALAFCSPCHSCIFRFKNLSGDHVTHAREKLTYPDSVTSSRSRTWQRFQAMNLR